MQFTGSFSKKSLHNVWQLPKLKQYHKLLQKLWNLFKKSCLSQIDIPCQSLVYQLGIDLPWSIQNREYPTLLTTNNSIYQQQSYLSQCQPSSSKLRTQGGWHCISTCPHQLKPKLFRKMHCRFWIVKNILPSTVSNKKNLLKPTASQISAQIILSVPVFIIFIHDIRCLSHANKGRPRQRHFEKINLLTFVRLSWNSSSLILASLYFLQFIHSSYISSIYSKGESFKTEK